jgi:hypothetical protein
MPRLRFLGFTSSLAVTIAAAAGGQSDQVSVPSWTGGGTVTIDRIDPNLMVGPASIGFVMNYGASAFETPAPAAGEVYDRRMHEIYVFWDFGDPASPWTKPVNVLAEWKNRNVAYGPFVRRRFGPGTYTVNAFCVEPASGKTATATTTFTVQDPDTYFSGNKTLVVDTAGTFDGAPAGATQYTTLSGAWAAYTGRSTPGRLLLKGGQAYSAFERTIGSGVTQHIHLGSYGTGRAVIENLTLDGTKTMITLDSAYATTGLLDVRIVGLAFEGPYRPAVASGTQAPTALGGTSAAKVLVTNCTFNGVQNVYNSTQVGGQAAHSFHIDDCSYDNAKDYQITQYDGAAGSWAAITGCKLVQNPDAYMAAHGGGPVRLSNTGWAYIAGNDIFSCTGSDSDTSAQTPAQPCFKWQTNVSRDGNRLNMHSNGMEGGQFVVRGLIDVPDLLGRAYRCNAVLDGNALTADYATSKMIAANGGGFTLRNNLMTVPGATASQEFSYFLGFGLKGAPYNAPDAYDTPNRAYGNTFVVLRTTAQNDPYGSPATSLALPHDAASFFLYVGTAYSGPSVVENNLDHAPGLANPRVAFAPIDTTTVLWAPRNKGHHPGPAGPLNTAYAPTTAVVRAAPLGGSPALGAALTGMAPEADIYGQMRPHYPSIGAFEGGF